MNCQRVIIVQLRRANPTKHLSTSSQGEIKLRPESLARALPLQDFSQGGLGRGLCQRRVRRRITRIKYFSIRLFLFQTTSKFFHRATTFYQRLPEKVVVSITSFTSKDCAPQQICLLIRLQSRRIKLEFKNLRMLLTYRTFNQLIFFFRDKCKFISRLFKMLKSRNFNIRLISSSFLWYGDSTGGPLFRLMKFLK